ncbi:MAG: hypothetical protein DMG35_15515 [Acidobacteria bacterium]|nr:MAG: hypothetical protein AUH86_05285 [Acidobacteria bacterium 13_1_40CM_4_58_4]PYT59093.1 MAG: hypothetical protein DMG35_15515 [Acidobacteriota bacterium]
MKRFSLENARVGVSGDPPLNYTTTRRKMGLLVRCSLMEPSKFNPAELADWVAGGFPREPMPRR